MPQGGGYQTSKVRNVLIWTITRRVAVIIYRRFGTNYRSHLQGSIILDSWFLTMVQIGRPETSVSIIVTRRVNSPEERDFHLIRGQSAKSDIKSDSIKPRAHYSIIPKEFFNAMFSDQWNGNRSQRLPTPLNWPRRSPGVWWQRVTDINRTERRLEATKVE